MSKNSNVYSAPAAATAGTHSPDTARALLAWAQAEARAGARWWRGAEADAAAELALAALEGLDAPRALARTRSRLRRLLHGTAGGRPVARGAEPDADAGASLADLVRGRAPSARALALAAGRNPRTVQRAVQRARQAAADGQMLLPLADGGAIWSQK